MSIVVWVVNLALLGFIFLLVIGDVRDNRRR